VRHGDGELPPEADLGPLLDRIDFRIVPDAE
jgi:hypothetical protein